MEWFTIAKIFNINNNKNIIIHTGLFHSERIITILKKYYNFKVLKSDGINSIKEIEKTPNYNGCTIIPVSIEKELIKLS